MSVAAAQVPVNNMMTQSLILINHILFVSVLVTVTSLCMISVGGWRITNSGILDGKLVCPLLSASTDVQYLFWSHLLLLAFKITEDNIL